MATLDDKPLCKYACGVQCEVIMGPFNGHSAWAKFVCPKCQRWNDWIRKPENESKPRREASQKDLVATYSKGYCEWCLRRAKELPPGHGLVAHHVREYHDGGNPDRENILILCDACHEDCHLKRRHYGHSELGQDPDRTEKRGPMGSLEERPPWE